MRNRNKAKKNFSLQQNSLSLIFKTKKRRSPNHYRVYENRIEIRLELEQRGSKINPVQKLLFEGQIKNFEQVMTNESYTDWLIHFNYWHS